MQRLGLLFCFIIGVTQLIAVTIDPRGTRPVEHGTRSEKCATEKEWPFCTTDEWGPKCPSGCRIEGLMNKYDHNLLKRIEKIRSLLDENTVKQRSTDAATKQTYDYLKDKLTTDAGHNNNYYDLAQNLRQRITDMKIKIDRQLRILAALKDRVKDQVVEMQRLEVDVDIKLRSCKGSCQGYAEFQVDHEDYVVLDKQINQLDSQSAQSIDSVKTLYVMKSRPLQDQLVDSIYKSKDTTGAVAAQRREDVFNDVPMVQLLLGEEGSSSSPATVSKDQVCVRLKQQNQDGRQPSRKKYKRQQCRARKAVPLCSDDDWVSKCPSGCRLQGLISQVESDVERKLRTVCETGKTYEDMAEKSMKAMTHIYNYNRRVIVNIYTSELKFMEQAERLAGNLTSLRKRSFRLTRELDELRRNAQKQLEDLYRTEVDVDRKLRGCSGSCQSALPFSVDHQSHQVLQTDMDQMDKTLNQRMKAGTPRDIPHIKLQPLDSDLAPSSEYKTIPTVRRELLTQFEDIGQNEVVLEELLAEAADVEALEPLELE